MQQFSHTEIKTGKELLKELQNSGAVFDKHIVENAIKRVEKHFKGKVRKSGRTSASHYLTVAAYVSRLGLGQDSILAGILHQSVNRGFETLNTISDEFGDDVALLIDGLSKLKTLTGTYNAETASHEFVNLLFSAADDIRIIIIRLVDKLHNILTIESLEKEKQLSSARKVINIYAPIAEYLGLGGVQRLLEDAAFKIIKPEHYLKVKTYTEDLYAKQNDLLNRFVKDLEVLFAEYKCEFVEIHARKKGLYSSYRKLKDKYAVNFDTLNLDEVSVMKDFFAIRVLVKDVQHCYLVLGLIHSRYEYSEIDFEDYISKPKENGYKSVHTVIDFEDVPLELQIRTLAMHDYNEYGPASHIAYKLKRKGVESGDLEWTKEFSNINSKKEITKEDYKIKAFKNSIFCFTPNGKVIKLRSGAMPLDFAFKVHTKIGLTYRGAVINGKMRNMDYKLKTGDIINILTTKKPNATWDWLDCVKSNVTRSHLRRYLNKNVEK